MNNTSTQITAAPAPPIHVSPTLPARRVDRWRLLKRLFKPLASLRLTVVLFLMSIVLIFCGTLAQMDHGLWAILSGYFRTFIAWIPWQVFIRFGQVFFWFPKTWHVSGSFPFPGGYVIGGLLLINLVAAHLMRFRMTWKRSGILLTHGGLILLMLGELFSGLFSIESFMTIPNGESRNYIERSGKFELAIIDPSDAKMDKVVVVPAAILQKSLGQRIQDECLPFDIEVKRYMVNSSEPRKIAPVEDNPATAGVGLEAIVDEAKPGVGVDPDQRIDMASTYVVLRAKDSGASLGTYLMSLWFAKTQPVKVNGKEYQATLRFQREYKPYTLHLEEFRHDLYPGTDIPKNFSSRVRLIDPSQNEDRQALIYMNKPLRYSGVVFYQSGWIPGDLGTKLMVVTNPASSIPYISCTMVALGMTIHFSILLLNFLQRRTAS